MIGKHPSWFRCDDCNVVFLEQHPKRCYCGSRNFVEMMTEDMFTQLGQKEHKNCTAKGCAELSNANLYRSDGYAD